MSRQAKLKPRKNPTQRRARETVEAILVAAAQVFEARGYARGTTDRIAARAGVSVGSLYQYFPNKDAILVALAERHIEQGTQLVEAMLTSAPRDPDQLEPWLRRLLAALLAQHRAQPRLQHLILEGLPLPDDVHDRAVAIEDRLTRELAGLLTGLADPGRLAQPTATAWTLVHAIQGLVHDFTIHPPADLDEVDLIDEIVAMVLGRLGR